MLIHLFPVPWRAGNLDTCSPRRLCEPIRFMWFDPSADNPDRPFPDCSYSISTNIVGQKLWTLFPPACTPALLPLLKTAEREDRSVDVRTWTQEVRQKFLELGMEEVVQVAGETIFMHAAFFFFLRRPP